MPDITLTFEVHQPYRLKKGFAYERPPEKVNPEDLFDLYFDDTNNRAIFEKISGKCYYPSTEIILDGIDRHKKEKKKFKVSFSLSGVFIEQCERYDKDLLDLFCQLSDTGCVEFLGQTYYHSLASLYEEKDEYLDQIRMHDQLMKDLIGHAPTFFENTELLYNNEIAGIVRDLGYKGIFTEGVERVLEWRSPNYVYKAKSDGMKVLFRNFLLTDDIGFRFSADDWVEYPLTADKYAAWLEATDGQCINIFMDYETLGEHHWEDTGIHNFLRFMPDEILKYKNLRFLTPSGVINKHKAVDEIDIGVYSTISWADLQRDTSCWIGNDMQMLCYQLIKRMEKRVKSRGDPELLKIWRYLQLSDHLYYTSTVSGASGDVHNYFSPYGNPIEAFVSLYTIVTDFERRFFPPWETEDTGE